MRGLSDKVLQMITKLLPNHLPERMNQFRDLYEHHLILRIEQQDVAAVQQFLLDYFVTRSSGNFSCVLKMKDVKHFTPFCRGRCCDSLS